MGHKQIGRSQENVRKRRWGEDIFFDPRMNRGSFDNVNNLGKVNLDTCKQLVAIRSWVGGNEVPQTKFSCPQR